MLCSTARDYIRTADATERLSIRQAVSAHVDNCQACEDWLNLNVQAGKRYLWWTTWAVGWARAEDGVTNE